jgi:hypothetical protein
MDINKKFGLLTNHLVLEKEKKHLELERFINDNINIEDTCSQLGGKLNDYRNSIENLRIWLEFIEPINNTKNENGEE